MFVGTFFICLFIFIMQFLWLYVDELVGKGIPMDALMKFFYLTAITLVPKALPMAILLAALITFGNFGERVELTAMKAAGIENPTHSPIRGGTDGCMLTYKGLLCPNLPAASHSPHGRFEYAPVESLKTGVKTVKNILSPELLETVKVK